jgi:hypothetical protein
MMRTSLLAVGVMCAAPVWAAKAVVFPFRAANVSEGDAQTATSLFRSQYQMSSGHDVVTLDAASAALAAQPDPAAASRALGCSAYVTGELSRLGARMFVNVEEHEASGRTVWTEHATAATPEDLETVLPRVAVALVRKQSYAETRTHETVTLRESEPPVRLRPDKIIGFRAGVVLPYVGGDDTAPSIEAGFDMRFERGRYFLGWATGLTLPTGDEFDDQAQVGLAFLEMHGAYYLADSEIGPYLGGGLQPRIVFVDREFDEVTGTGGDTDGGVGLGLLARAGVMFARSSRMRLFAEVVVDQEMAEVGGVHPTLVHLDLGMGW